MTIPTTETVRRARQPHQVGDVNLLRREIHVRHQVQLLFGGEGDIRLPKHNSERTVHAAQTLIDELAEHVALAPTNEWLFEGNGKLPPHQNTIGLRWRRLLSRAGVSGVQPHDLRHFYAPERSLPVATWRPSSGQRGTPGPHPALTTYAHCGRAPKAACVRAAGR